MSEEYRLVFEGELLDGQHPAVVRKKLGELLKLSEPQLEKLLSGARVVIKKSVDEATAARYLGAFRQAGAKLRVQELTASGAGDAPGAAPTSASAPAPPTAAPSGPSEGAAAASAGDSGLTLSPPGADLLAGTERAAAPSAQVDTSHLTLAEPGAVIGAGDAAEAPPVTLDIDFDLAEPGALLIEPRERAAPVPARDAPDLTLAEPGARVSPASDETAPPAPDTSHLSLDDDR
jgi:hypothetical protein